MVEFDDDQTRRVSPEDVTSDAPHVDPDLTLIRGQAGDAPGLATSEFGGYRVIQELGRGGQGLVYLAEDEKLGRRVALKILSSALAFSRAAKARFEREAEVASKLDHPGIARIYELGHADDLPFIAMEYVQGESLAEHIEASKSLKGRESVTQVSFDAKISDAKTRSSKATGPESGVTGRAALMTVVRYVEDAARTLHAAHEAGLIHRDIKPGNLMVRPDGSAYILDFGLARDENSTSVALNQTGDVMGTPAYMSPE